MENRKEKKKISLGKQLVKLPAGDALGFLSGSQESRVLARTHPQTLASPRSRACAPVGPGPGGRPGGGRNQACSPATEQPRAEPQGALRGMCLPLGAAASANRVHWTGRGRGSQTKGKQGGSSQIFKDF